MDLKQIFNALISMINNKLKLLLLIFLSAYQLKISGQNIFTNNNPFVQLEYSDYWNNETDKLTNSSINYIADFEHIESGIISSKIRIGIENVQLKNQDIWDINIENEKTKFKSLGELEEFKFAKLHVNEFKCIKYSFICSKTDNPRKCLLYKFLVPDSQKTKIVYILMFCVLKTSESAELNFEKLITSIRFKDDITYENRSANNKNIIIPKPIGYSFYYKSNYYNSKFSKRESQNDYAQTNCTINGDSVLNLEVLISNDFNENIVFNIWTTNSKSNQNLDEISFAKIKENLKFLNKNGNYNNLKKYLLADSNSNITCPELMQPYKNINDIITFTILEKPNLLTQLEIMNFTGWNNIKVKNYVLLRGMTVFIEVSTKYKNKSDLTTILKESDLFMTEFLSKNKLN